MATFKYPQSEFDKPENLLSVMGSFWATTYQGNFFVQDIAQVTGQMANQSHRQLIELVASVSRFSIPLYHQKNWHPLTILESELNTDPSLIAKYVENSTNLYQATTGLNYGQSTATKVYSVAKPAELASVQTIFNRLTEPSVQLTVGLDYTVTADVIAFRENPFDNGLIPKRDLLNSAGEVIDRECVLWLYQGEWDWDTVYEQFGYALRLKLQTSQGYKDFVNAIFDALNFGTSLRAQQQAFAAAFGVPLVIEASERVEAVNTDNDSVNVITDSHVYQFPLGTTVVVSVGDVVSAGDPLTDLFQIYEFNRGQEVSPNDISALTVGSGLLSSEFSYGLTFENEDTAVDVEMDVAGYTKVSWDLGGFVLDVDKFWSDVHATGVAKQQTLAMLLDVRENPVGQPTAASLPSTINPLQFLTDNLLRNNAWVLKVKVGSELAGGLSFIPVDQIRKIQPPHTVLIVIVELVYADSPVIMDGTGTATDPGYEESQSGFPCMTVSETMDPATYISENVRTSQIGGRCV